ncbi:MAG: peptidase S10 [Chlamydiae bacterium CG10_big_fil_rev_8_21_14_0_10_42_34]|nr:MAG: peptidase S10 [Chlamydiae bacterium CG10_big_fil_rev_8_21_14_0_10_42_34]
MLQILFSFLLLSSLFSEQKISSHTIDTQNETLDYTVTVETGEISYTSYTKEGENRPITFAFNGGPGSSSVWLHLGCFGPRRILMPEEGQSSIPPYQLIDNSETILDLTDLVFIDPMGTGFSKASSKEDEKNFYSIKNDVESVGKFIRDYLTKNQRWNSPKYIAGESYGAMRAAGLADYLHNEFGIYLNGLIMISAAIDYQTFIFDNDNPVPYFIFLPSYATTAWYHGKYRPDATVEEVAQEARDFVYQTYAPSLLCRKCFDAQSINETLSKITALPLEIVQKNYGRIDDDQFFFGLFAKEKKMVGRFDSRIIGFSDNIFQDPSDIAIYGIFAGAFHDYLHKELGFQDSYTLVSFDINRKWDYWDYNRWGYPNLMGGLRRALVTNPNMKVFFGCGYFDLATPFAATEYCLDHLDVPNACIQTEYYEGGHMYYTNPKARIKFKQDLIRFYEENR